MKTTIENTESRTPTARRSRFLAEVQRLQTQSGLEYDEAYQLAANDAEFAAEFSNAEQSEMEKADAQIAGAAGRRVKLDKAIKDLMDTGLSYDVAFARALAQTGLGATMKQPSTPGLQTVRNFSFADPNDTIMPRAVLPQKGVVSQWDDKTTPPKVGNRLTGVTA
jgi:hypothetical protein